MPNLIRPPLSLYIHLPWCVRKCPYCDFNSHALSGTLPEREYVDALLADLAQDVNELKIESKLHSVFIGGGTPSLFSPASLERLLIGIRRLLPWEEDAEITLEANPGAVESGKLQEFRALGINRLSLGIQSFQDAKLNALGRIHTAREALTAIETAKAAGFSNLNLDLMFGLPQQTLADALADIRSALAADPTHLSWYQLTLEPGTWFAKYPPPLPDEDSIWAMARAGQEELAKAGFSRYEISAYAKAGFACRHNLNYWRFGDYLGIGAGAHGKWTDPGTNTIWRTWKIRHPYHYLEKAATPLRLGGKTKVQNADKPLEFLMNALRLKEGFSPSQFESRTGLPFSTLAPVLDEWMEEEFLAQNQDRIACTPLGWDFLDTLLERLVSATTETAF
ncbi:radical SAM family heme chaperone HemW [Methylothermus subterraneus]